MRRARQAPWTPPSTLTASTRSLSPSSLPTGSTRSADPSSELTARRPRRRTRRRRGQRLTGQLGDPPGRVGDLVVVGVGGVHEPLQRLRLPATRPAGCRLGVEEAGSTAPGGPVQLRICRPTTATSSSPMSRRAPAATMASSMESAAPSSRASGRGQLERAVRAPEAIRCRPSPPCPGPPAHPPAARSSPRARPTRRRGTPLCRRLPPTAMRDARCRANRRAPGHAADPRRPHAAGPDAVATLSASVLLQTAEVRRRRCPADPRRWPRRAPVGQPWWTVGSAAAADAGVSRAAGYYRGARRDARRAGSRRGSRPRASRRSPPAGTAAGPNR